MKDEKVGSDTPPPKRPAGKLGAEKLTPEEQRRRFEELATELGCDQSEEAFNAALRMIARQKPKTH